jgi:drug/metabolite transporter (DMT)-like permease
VPAPSQTRAYIALVVIVALWGSYPAAAKLALADFPPVFMAAARCLVASAFLVAMLLRSGAETVREVTPRALATFLVLGLAGITVSTNLSYLAIYFSTASSVVLLQAATPVMVAVAARFYLGERLRKRQWAGVAVSTLGVVVIITEGRLIALRPGGLRTGDLINLVGLCGWSLYTVYGKRILATYSPALATTMAYVLGTVPLIPLAAVTTPLFPPPRWTSGVAWAVVLYQAILGAIAHVWWYKAVHVVGASRAAMFMNLQPVVGVALAALVLAEAVSVWELLGGVLVLVGVGLTTRVVPPRDSRPATPRGDA